MRPRRVVDLRCSGGAAGSAAGKKQQEVGVDYCKELGGEPPLLLLGFNAGRTGCACVLACPVPTVCGRTRSREGDAPVRATVLLL